MVKLPPALRGPAKVVVPLERVILLVTMVVPFSVAAPVLAILKFPPTVVFPFTVRVPPLLMVRSELKFKLEGTVTVAPVTVRDKVGSGVVKVIVPQSKVSAAAVTLVDAEPLNIG